MQQAGVLFVAKHDANVLVGNTKRAGRRAGEEHG